MAIIMRATDGLKQLLFEFGIESASDAGLKLQKYLSLLEKWNTRVNLTANVTWGALEPLFREGIWAAINYLDGQRTHLDIGSGAGFPAIILRTVNPKMKLDMVESRGKKGAFLETVAWELGLTGTCVNIKRLEDLLSTCETGQKIWDCVSWKAVRPARQTLLRLRDHVRENAAFWMFHGREAATEDGRMLDNGFVVVERRPVPRQKESFLSIYKATSENPKIKACDRDESGVYASTLC